MKTQKNTRMLAGTALLCLTLLGSCSKSETPSGSEPGTPLAIRLSAGLTASTKAPVNTGDTFSAAVAGWESEGTINYGTKCTWQTSSTITATETAEEAITMGEAQYYSQNRAVKTNIKAWSPAGTLADDGKVTFGGTPTGEVDVLLSAAVSGSAADAGVKNLAFNHQLSQLKFVINGDASFAAVKLTSITVLEAALPTGLDLTTDVVTYAAAASLAVPNIDGTQSITTTPTQAGRSVMLKPFAGKTFKVNVVTSAATYNDVLVTIDGTDNFTPGKAYTITLTFSGLLIKCSATVTPWADGTGSGTVQ